MSSVAATGGDLADQMWRLHHLYHIIDKSGQDVVFKPNWAQIDLWKNWWNRNTILKARQLGFSTFIDLVALDTCLFNKNYHAGIIAHKKEAATKLLSEKIQYPYDHLPPELYAYFKEREKTDSKTELKWDTGSSIYVDVSMRGGTIQFLHVSELGKISATRPDAAREIVTGALEAVPMDGIVVIESTAEGQSGAFYENCKMARELKESGANLTRLDFKFHFYPWFDDPSYCLTDEEAESVPISPVDEEYFLRLEHEIGKKLSKGQKAWYVAKRRSVEMVQGGDMKREYPATPDEAFEAAVEGAYFTMELRQARERGHICRVPHVPGIPVDTFWDMGIDDYCAIWFFQQVGQEHRFIRYIEDNDKGNAYYIRLLRQLEVDEGWTIGELYLPGDGEHRHRTGLGLTDADEFEQANFRVTIVQSLPGDIDAQIRAARRAIPLAMFDQDGCAVGLARLSGFRKQWDKRLGAFRENYLHDINSHGATAFLKYAVGYQPRHPRSFEDGGGISRRRRRFRSNPNTV